MGFVSLTAEIPAVSATDVYAVIARFEDYPSHCDAVREVKLIERTATTLLSTWEVNFRRGILRWTERASFDDAAMRIDFVEVDGDVDEFVGCWSVVPSVRGARVSFEVKFDIGIPALEHILEPIAEQALLDNVRSILRGLLGDEISLVSAASRSGRTCTF